MDRNLNLLGIARKAGLIAVGAESAGAAARSGKAHLIISASDASAGTIRRAQINAEESGAVYAAVPYTKFELGGITGRGSPGTVAFLDAGLAAGFMRGLEEMDPERYGITAKQLDKNADALMKKKKPTPNKRRTAQ